MKLCFLFISSSSVIELVMRQRRGLVSRCYFFQMDSDHGTTHLSRNRGKNEKPRALECLSFSGRCSPDVDVPCILKYATCWHAAQLKLNDSWSSQHSYMLPCHCCLDKMPWLIFIKSDELWQFLLLSGQPQGSSNLYSASCPCSATATPSCQRGKAILGKTIQIHFCSLLSRGARWRRG